MLVELTGVGPQKQLDIRKGHVCLRACRHSSSKNDTHSEITTGFRIAQDFVSTGRQGQGQQGLAVRAPPRSPSSAHSTPKSPFQAASAFATGLASSAGGHWTRSVCICEQLDLPGAMPACLHCLMHPLPSLSQPSCWQARLDSPWHLALQVVQCCLHGMQSCHLGYVACLVHHRFI